MNDYRILMIGKNAASENVADNTITEDKYTIFNSNCYFDWFQFYSLNSSASCTVEEKMNAFYQKYSSERTSRSNNSLGYHIQQSLMLVSDGRLSFEENLDYASRLYLSLISLPMWDNCSDADRYVELHKNCYDMIVASVLESGLKGISVYHSLDHCDFIMVCNGDEVNLDQYIQLIKTLREKTSESGNKYIHDITSIYGYNKNKIESKETEEKLNIVVSLSKKNIGETLPLLNDKNKWDQIMDAIGRYDSILVSKEIQWKDFAQVSEELSKYTDRLFASRIHICMPAESQNEGEGQTPPSPSRAKSSLITDIQNKFETHIKSITQKIKSFFDEDTSNQICYALREIYHSVCIMLEREFSKYFILCFYESFCQLLKYIDEKLLIETISNADEKCDLSEKIYDLLNSYFTYLRTLSSSTLHNERRFLQADPCQLTYFDIPPKLIAFYTAIASNMSKELTSSSDCSRDKSRYTFLIVPDFKKDVYVDSLTNNRDMFNETNILVIHINEKSMYDISRTTKIIAHEIAHHAGLNDQARKDRAKYYMRCITAKWLADILSERENSACHIFDTVNADHRYDLFVHLVNVLCDCFTEYQEEREQEVIRPFKIDENISTASCELTDYYLISAEIKKYYYSDFFVDEFKNRIYQCILYQHFWEYFLDKLKASQFDYWQCFYKYLEEESEDAYFTRLSRKFQTKDSDFIRNYVFNIFSNELCNRCKCYENVDANAISHVFREGVADMQMLILTTPRAYTKEQIIASYGALHNSVRINQGDRAEGAIPSDENLRKEAVTNCFNSFENRCTGLFSPVSNDFEHIAPQCFASYLVDQASQYFQEISTVKAYLQGNAISAFDYENMIGLFGRQDVDINDIVKTMDKTICEYTQHLIENQ